MKRMKRDYPPLRMKGIAILALLLVLFSASPVWLPPIPTSITSHTHTVNTIGTAIRTDITTMATHTSITITILTGIPIERKGGGG